MLKTELFVIQKLESGVRGWLWTVGCKVSVPQWLLQVVGECVFVLVQEHKKAGHLRTFPIEVDNLVASWRKVTMVVAVHCYGQLYRQHLFRM